MAPQICLRGQTRRLQAGTMGKGAGRMPGIEWLVPCNTAVPDHREVAPPGVDHTHRDFPCRDRGDEIDAQGGLAYIALIESRAKDVGIASLNSRSLCFDFTQFTDTSDFSRTLASVLALDPAVLVMSKTARGTQMYDVMRRGVECRLELVDRRYFDEAAGKLRLEKADVAGLQPSEYGAKFVACAALAAIWTFAEFSMEARLLTHATRVTFHGPADTMTIDCGTVKLLEIISRPGDRHRNESSLNGLFSCRTPGGSRILRCMQHVVQHHSAHDHKIGQLQTRTLLHVECVLARQSLLQPPATCAEIRSRQAAVEALLSNEDLFHELRKLLPFVSDLDVLAARVTMEPKSRGVGWCKAATRTVARLQQAFAMLPKMGAALSVLGPNCAPLLQGAQAELADASFPMLVAELERVIDAGSPMTSKSGQGAMGHAALLYA
eukprot:3556915-Amphidinium_carterae.1